MKFENPDVAAKYEPARKDDCHVHIPAGKKTDKNPNPVGYAGPLSKITLVCADKAHASGANFLTLKDQKPAARTVKQDPGS